MLSGNGDKYSCCSGALVVMAAPGRVMAVRDMVAIIMAVGAATIIMAVGVAHPDPNGMETGMEACSPTTMVD